MGVHSISIKFFVSQKPELVVKMAQVFATFGGGWSLTS